jgi:hypothetical protein
MIRDWQPYMNGCQVAEVCPNQKMNEWPKSRT